MAEKFTQKEVDEMIDSVYKNKNEDDDENDEKMNQYLNSKKIKTYDVLSPEEIDELLKEIEESCEPPHG